MRARISYAIADLGEENVFLVATDGIICNGTLPTSEALGEWSNRDDAAQFGRLLTLKRILRNWQQRTQQRARHLGECRLT